MKLKYVGGDAHMYWIDGDRCKGASSLGKTIDNMYLLELWALRQTLKGVVLKPDLIEFVAAHYDDNRQLNDAVKQARDIAGSNDASRRGIVLHKILERIDLGQIVFDTPMSLAVRDAWGEALDKAGLEILPEWVERIVCHPELLVAGTLDRIVRRRSDGRHAVLDVKGGKNVIDYPNGISVQLATYARAPLATVGAGKRDGNGQVWEEFEPLPENMDLDVGYIAHIPEDNGEVFIHEIDIAAGWLALENLIRPVHAWQKHKVATALVAGVAIGTQNDSPPVPESHGGSGQAEVQATVGRTAVREVQPSATVAAIPFYNDQIQSRTLSISGDFRPDRTATTLQLRSRALTPDQVTYCLERWPVGVPLLREGGHTLDQLYEIQDLIDEAEAFTGLPDQEHWVHINSTASTPSPNTGVSTPCVPSASNASKMASGESGSEAEASPARASEPTSPERSETSPTSLKTSKSTGTTAPTEGRTLPLENRDAIQRRYNGLTPERQSMIQQWLTQAAAGCPVGFGLRDQVTERRFDTMAGIVNAVDMGLNGDTILTLVGIAMGLDGGVPDYIPIGRALGSMHHTEAAVFARLVDAIGHDEVPLTKAGKLGARAMPALAALADEMFLSQPIN